MPTVGVVFWEVLDGYVKPVTYSYEVNYADHAVAEKGDVVMVKANGNLRFPRPLPGSLRPGEAIFVDEGVYFK